MAASTNDEFVFKVLIVGDASIGKTCLIHRLCDKTFFNSYVATLGVDVKEWSTMTQNNRPQQVKLQLWDTAGQERFRTLTSNFYRGAHAVLFCYDISNATSFTNVRVWAQSIDSNLNHHRNNDNDNDDDDDDDRPHTATNNSDSSLILTALVGTKCDLADEGGRKVQEDEGKSLARKLEIGVFGETSAKNDIHVTALFEEVAEKLVARASALARRPLSTQASNNNNNVHIIDDDDDDDDNRHRSRSGGGSGGGSWGNNCSKC